MDFNVKKCKVYECRKTEGQLFPIPIYMGGMKLIEAR